ncbi:MULTISPECIES: ABC transporter permease subunit [Nostocales]|uniref:Branched-chain amino acid ABC transporter n=3 Tax=Nostocales TaxID=1161 RepID=A0A0C1R6B9_9CYAN|nr:branched-chain amino acid ABC transporter permease [Tolypothrix bouteillei]KAF3887880.1 branched-chain amino acid ABC transporter permease [Tolypothrix bouteillei VB521301]
MFAEFLEAVFNGISIGAVLLMAALGLAIVFGLMGVINMAHGELMMLGAYATFVVQNACKQLGGVWFEIYIFFALIVAFAISAAVGWLLERGVIRYLYGRPLETLLATWGVSLILQQFVRSVNSVLVIGIALFCLLFLGGLWILKRRTDFGRVQNWIVAAILFLSVGVAISTGKFLSETYKLAMTQPWFGAQNLDVTAPSWLQDGISLAGVQLPYPRLFIIALTILCVTGIYLFLQRSHWGLRIRAVTQNRNMSACLGIPTQKVDAITFALGSGLAGVAGCAIALLGSVGPNTGQNYIIDTFMVVVVGGVGNLVGTIVAALGIGTANYLIGSATLASLLTPVKPLADLFAFFATTSMAKATVFALIIVFLQVKPGGIFPQKGRSVDV